jgi:hypothetical protein
MAYYYRYSRHFDLRLGGNFTLRVSPFGYGFTILKWPLYTQRQRKLFSVGPYMVSWLRPYTQTDVENDIIDLHGGPINNVP